MGKYTILEKTIEFEECNERFFDIQYRVWKAMAAVSNEFNQWYDSCGDILTVLKGYEKQATGLVIKNSNEPLFNELPQLGIYDMSEESYDEECLVFEAIGNALDKVADAYNEIVAQQEAEEEYRAERKASRGRVVGGGFGVGGALKGMATAGAMNAVSGAGHSIVNAFGNLGSAIEASSAKRALYNNASVKALLRESVRDDVLSCFNAHIHLVNTRKENYYINCFDSDKAGALFQNAKKVPEKREELLIESFKYCPWDEDLLIYLFVNYPAQRKNVWLTAKRFHVELHQVAEECFSQMYNTNAKNSEEAAQTVKKEIMAQMKELGITVSGTVDRIERDGVARLLRAYDAADTEKRQEMFAKVDAYDAAERNKSVIIHEKGVWELARKYHVSFSTEEIERILGAVYTPIAKKEENEALKAKTKMRGIMNELGVKESAVFDSLESDCVQRLCEGYQSADEQTCNAMVERIRAYSALDKNKQKFLRGIQSRIESIWAAEDGEIFDNLFLKTDIHNQEELANAITYVKEKGRTSSANKYIFALQGCTEENIKKALLFQKPIMKCCQWAGLAIAALGFILAFCDAGILLSMAVAAIGVTMLVYYYNMKKVWDQLTLGGTLIHSMLSLTRTEAGASVAQPSITNETKTLTESEDNKDGNC